MSGHQILLLLQQQLHPFVLRFAVVLLSSPFRRSLFHLGFIFPRQEEPLLVSKGLRNDWHRAKLRRPIYLYPIQVSKPFPTTRFVPTNVEKFRVLFSVGSTNEASFVRESAVFLGINAGTKQKRMSKLCLFALSGLHLNWLIGLRE